MLGLISQGLMPGEALTGPPLPHRVFLYSKGDHSGKEHIKQETLLDIVFGIMDSRRRKGPGGVNLRVFYLSGGVFVALENPNSILQGSSICGHGAYNCSTQVENPT